MIRRAALGLAALLATSGCVQFVGPSRTDTDYGLKAANTAEAVASAVATAELAVDQATQGRLTQPYAAVILSEAEEAAAGAADTFAGIQPPSTEADDLREELAALVDDAVDVLGDLRIAARRSDTDALADLAAPLPQLGDELEAFAEAHGVGP